MTEKKFFIRKWYFWLSVILNWVWLLLLAKDKSFLDYPAFFLGAFLFVFIVWLCIWIIIKFVKGIKKLVKK